MAYNQFPYRAKVHRDVYYAAYTWCLDNLEHDLWRPDYTMPSTIKFTLAEDYAEFVLRWCDVPS